MLCTTCGADAGVFSKVCPRCGSPIVRTAEPDEYVGKTLAQKYRVEALIGEGGMGKVYRACQLALDKQVVLKVLRHSLLSDGRTVARFQREAKAASRLNHPNSIGILDFGQAEDGALFIAMEFVAGVDLHQLLVREWPLAEARVVRIVSQVLSALSDAHGAGVIHRDLKPENIMVEQRRNEPDFVKVLDFGIAKITDGSEDGPTLTRAGFVCGTPEYMSPEQARGAPLDHRSDLYAVGVLLYQLMTGLLPFDADSAVGFATKHLNEEPLPPTARRPDARISSGMERLILRALSKDPNARPQDAEAFKAELAEVDKERRRGEAGARRPKTSPVLAPIPRRATPGDQIDTNPSTTPAWQRSETQQDATVRKVPEPRTVPAPKPAVTVASPARVSADEQQVITQPGSAGGFDFFKALTLLMVLAAVGFAGYYYYSFIRNAPPEAPFVPPPNAPVPGQAGGAPGEAAAAPLYEQDISSRDVEASVRAEREGDAHLKQGLLKDAANEYRKSFQLHARPEVALKLGEVYWQRNEAAEARGWWRRHLRDAPDSTARSYIEQQLGEKVGDARLK